MNKRSNFVTHEKAVVNDTQDDVVFVREFSDEDRREKKQLKKFATSQEDDALSENWSEDQEEQNEIHNNFFDNQPKK